MKLYKSVEFLSSFWMSSRAAKT